jgi:hypothetical protein
LEELIKNNNDENADDLKKRWLIKK